MFSVKYQFEPKSALTCKTEFIFWGFSQELQPHRLLTSPWQPLANARCFCACFVYPDAPHAALHLKGIKKTLRTTWQRPKVDASVLYRFLTQCVSVRLYSLGVSLLCKHESTPVLRQWGSLKPSNHSPAERNQSKVDVSMPLQWWMGLTREMMDDQGGHVCFISCRTT